MGSGILNPHRRYLDKWEMYKALTGEAIGPCQLPATVLYSETTLYSMLQQHQSVFVKPIDTWGGNLIGVVSRDNGVYRLDMQKQLVRHYRSLPKLHQHLKLHYQGHTCIVQDAAPLVQYQKRPFDIRIHMQRNEENAWVYAGDLIRVGGSHSNVSNVGISGGNVFATEDVLRHLLVAKKARRVRKELEHIGHAITNILDGYHPFNEVGIDLGMEASGRLWLIEVNTDDALGAPSHELFASHPDGTLYRQLRERAETRRVAMASALLDAFF